MSVAQRPIQMDLADVMAAHQLAEVGAVVFTDGLVGDGVDLIHQLGSAQHAGRGVEAAGRAGNGKFTADVVALRVVDTSKENSDDGVGMGWDVLHGGSAVELIEG